MKAGWRTARRAGRIALALVAVALAGCSADVASQIGKDAQVRDRVMGVIAGNGDLAEQMMQRLVGTDSLRARVIETVLRDKEGAQYVIGRIGRNSEALDYVLQVAAADSAGRVHLMTLFKGMQMAMQAKK